MTPSPIPTGSVAPYPDCLPEYARYVYISGSVNIDAVSGKILSVTRPIRYSNYGYYDYACHAPGASPYPSAYPSAMATSDI